MINELASRLKLPEHWRIHNAFHISLFKKYQGLEPIELVLKDPPKVEELEEILQSEQIVYHTIHKGPQGRKFYRYLVKFKNYSALHAKWMDEDTLSDHPEILDIYKEAFQLRSID